jgi:hypothetical protein
VIPPLQIKERTGNERFHPSRGWPGPFEKETSHDSGCSVSGDETDVGNTNKMDLVYLCLAKSSAATKNETLLDRAGLNVIIVSTEHPDFGGQEPCAHAAHIYKGWAE